MQVYLVNLIHLITWLIEWIAQNQYIILSVKYFFAMLWANFWQKKVEKGFLKFWFFPI